MKPVTQEMTVDKWLEALKESDVDSEGFSNRDLRMALGITEATAGKLLRRWSDRGMLALAGYKDDIAINGRPVRIPVYKPIQQPKKKTNPLRGRKK